MKQYRNFFSQVNNGQFSTKGYIHIEYNRFAVRLLQILQQHGFISHWCLEVKSTAERRPYLTVYYKKEPCGTLSTTVVPFRIEGVSTRKSPAFVEAEDLWQLDRGLSVYILSTSRGFITDRQARKWNIGGKVICIVKS